MNYKTIAQALRREASRYPAATSDQLAEYYDGDLAAFTFGSLTIRCKPFSDCIHKVADKFDKGPGRIHKPLAIGGQPSKARRFSKAVFDNFIEDDEVDNALNYVRVFPRDKWPPGVIAYFASAQEDPTT